MTMKKFEIDLPADLNIEAFEIKMSLAAKLFDLGKISSGQGASIVGISKRAFLELLGEFGVSIFGYSEDDLESDLDNA